MKKSTLDAKLEAAVADTLRRLVSGQPERGVARAIVVAVKRVLAEEEVARGHSFNRQDA